MHPLSSTDNAQERPRGGSRGQGCASKHMPACTMLLLHPQSSGFSPGTPSPERSKETGHVISKQLAGLETGHGFTVLPRLSTALKLAKSVLDAFCWKILFLFLWLVWCLTHELELVSVNCL